MADYNTLRLTQDSRGVLTIELNRPEKRNAFNGEVIRELTTVFENEALAPEARVILLKGSGKVFCAGGDLNWMKESVDLSYEENLKDTRALTRLFSLMNEIPRPLVGLIQGAAIGGGVGMVSVCDLAIATQDSVFGLSEVRLGLIPACIGPFVVSKIGASHARGLFMIGERFGAERAKEVGLIHEVVDDVAGLEKAAERIVNNILLCAPSAMAFAKKLVLDLSWPEKRAQCKDPYEYASEMLARIRVSQEGQEGVRAFLGKRNPSWQKE